MNREVITGCRHVSCHIIAGGGDGIVVLRQCLRIALWNSCRPVSIRVNGGGVRRIINRDGNRPTGRDILTAAGDRHPVWITRLVVINHVITGDRIDGDGGQIGTPCNNGKITTVVGHVVIAVFHCHADLLRAIGNITHRLSRYGVTPRPVLNHGLIGLSV